MALLTLALILPGCGGGDPLPTAAGADSAGPAASTPPPPPGGPAPAPAPDTGSPVRRLALNGVAVLEPFDLSVSLRREPQGDRYRFEIDALNWDVQFDLDTWELPGRPTDVALTSDLLVPTGGLTIRRLRVNGATLGTTGTSADLLDRCRSRDDDEDDREGRNRQGLIEGRLSRLDEIAEGSFTVEGTDDRCSRLTGTIELTTPLSR